MYFDNLTIAGILVASAYGLLPLLFGRELWRVAEDGADAERLPGAIPAAAPATAHASRQSNEIPQTAPCA
jgi:hypothetical protein